MSATGIGELALALANLPRVHSSIQTGTLSWIGPPSCEACLVLHADRRIWVSRAALNAHMEHQEPGLDFFEHEGSICLRITSANRGPIVYKMTGYSIGTDCWLAEMVD